jgi:predicted dehydrogenase
MIKCAVAGYGWWGQTVSQRLAGSERLTIAYVVEPGPERAASAREAGLATRPALEDALGDPGIDAIILTTPNLMHEEQVRAAASAGKHVFCEKPLALSQASAARAVAACRDAGVVLGVGHERRFEPAIAEVKRRVESGALGTIMHAEAAFSHDKLIGVPKGDWRTDPVSAPAAAMTGMGIHLTDLYIWMFGPVASVAALTADRVLGWETGDVVTVQMRFQAGMTATLSAILKTPLFLRYHVFGSDAWAEVRNETHPDTPGGTAELVVQTSAAAAERRAFDWTDAVVANLEAFADAVEGRVAYKFTPEEMVHNIAVLEAIAQSARTESVVQLAGGQTAAGAAPRQAQTVQAQGSWQQWT